MARAGEEEAAGEDGECFLFTLPEELFYGHLFPYLKINDLLRLRRTCQHLRLYAEDYLRNHAQLSSQVREINETTHTVEDYLHLDLPTAYVYVNNISPRFYEDPYLPQFLRMYGSQITHLRVRQFSTCISASEHAFFLGMTHIQYLDIETIDARNKVKTRRVESERTTPEDRCYFPVTFRGLRSLTLNEVLVSSEYDCEYAWDFLHFCPNLVYFRYPYFTTVNPTSPILLIGQCKVVHYMYKRAKNFPGEPNLILYDFQHHRRNGLLPRDRYEGFVDICSSNDVKLLNINAEQHQCLEESNTPDNDRFFEFLARSVVSLENVSAPLVTEMAILEKLVITKTSACSFRRKANGQLPLGDFLWPKLRTLEITIDSERLTANRAREQHPTCHLVTFLFSSVKRPNLKKLSIGYKKSFKDKAHYPYPRAADVARNCENVTKITLINWVGTNKALVTIWAGLPKLEEVTLESCLRLGNVGFVGQNREDPIFFKLPKLRKLALLGLDVMPKITDLIFKLVFRHLTLQEFYLTSAKPVKSVTINGIEALLEGPFGESIERFPFEGWSLESVSPEQLSILQARFRSSSML